MLSYDRDVEVLFIRLRDDESEICNVIQGKGSFYIAVNKKGEVVFIEIHAVQIDSNHFIKSS